MYPFLRMAHGLIKTRNQSPLPLTGCHESEHRCWPWDIDLWMELNNGRTLTLYDLGRIPLAQRVGLVKVLRERKWGLTMAGVSVRYRKRIRTFETFKMKSRTICWDEKFVYLEQSMWKQNGDCAGHAMYRSAVTDKNGIVAPKTVIEALGQDPTSPEMPEWVRAWVDADATRPWPPMQD